MTSALLTCLSSILILTAFPALAAEAEAHSDHGSTQQEILILNSYHPGYAWSDDEQAGIIDLFQAKNKNWLPVIEYMDLKRLPDGRHLAELKQLFRLKYQSKKFSAVIAMDNPALEFAIDNQTELFRNTPIVFCGINHYTPSLLKGHSDVTGIVESMDIAGTIEVMLRLHPATREIFVPHDYTVTGLAVRKEIEALVPRFSARVRFRFADSLTMEDLLKELERLPKNSLVLEIGFITDKSYRTFGVTETTKLFNEHSPVPIYSTYEQRLGFGIVGGKLLSARIHGTNAARIALRVLAGEKASAIPVVFESDSQFMFDYKVMKRFNIPLSSLPEGSTVINKPVSFYTAHRVVILTALGIIGILIVVISLLTIIIVQRRRSVVALRASEAKYYDLYENAPDMYFSVDMKTATITECNNMFVEAFGNSKEEILGLSIFEIPHPDGRGEAKRVFQQFATTGEVHDAERMIKRKNGEIIHVSLNASAVRDEAGRITHSRSVWRDITERKRAEYKLSESEKKYRMLFNAIDEGFCIIEVIFDENEKPIDYRFLEINPSFEKQTGLIGAQGKRMRELAPKHEEHWFEIYGKIALTGQPARFVNRAEQLHRWYDVYAFRIDQPEKRQVAVLFNDITDSRRAEEELRDSREQMRAFAGRLQVVREEERTRIAREIHDGLGGALTGLKIDVSLLTRAALKIENGTVRASLLAGMDSMIKFIDATIQTVRRIAMELRPGVLDDLGLVAALEWQLKDFEKRTGIRCDFFPPAEDISLDADLSTALFRIFQEALTNVARHSNATEVCVRLRADADSSTLEVEDNGKGIEKEQTRGSKSLGLLGMRERAQMFGGRITVTGTPGRGTIVTVEIPSVEKRKTDRDQEGDAG